MATFASNRRPIAIETYAMPEVSSDRRMRVLAFADYFFPALRGGGTITTLRNLIHALGTEVAFHLVTRNCDAGIKAAYSSVPTGSWTSFGPAEVLYIPPENMNLSQTKALLREQHPHALYLNSVLSRRFTLVPLIARRLSGNSDLPVILAPRGEFSVGARSLKRPQKLAYIAALKASGLLRDICWQASSEHEASDIREIVGSKARIHVAPDIVALPPKPHRTRAKRPGEAECVFLGRISPIKNLEAVLRALSVVTGRITLALYGPIEDEGYWRRCQVMAGALLPPSVQMEYRGMISADNVSELLAEFDVLCLPSLGENFAHVVPEALSAGCPVIVSDRTPWRGLAGKGVGWDIALEDRRGISEALQAIVDMDEAEHAAWRARARAFAEEITANKDILAANRALFATAAGRAAAV